MVSHNSWKYSTLGLLAILVVGISLPQASAHITNSTAHMLQHIYNFVDGIEAKTDNLPSDPASNTVVNTRASQASVDDLQDAIENLDSSASGMKIYRDAVGAFGFADTDVTLTCTSDSDFVLHVTLTAAGPDQSTLQVTTPVWQAPFRIQGDESEYIVFGGNADDEIKLQALVFPDDSLSVFVALETSQDATPSCEES